MDGDVVGQGGTELRTVARLIAETVPRLVAALAAMKPGRVHGEALALLEGPLLAHALALTGGNQLRAARLLGLNRNTLRKRCRQLQLLPPRPPRRAPGPAARAPLS